jgi:hypothetical protein
MQWALLMIAYPFCHVGMRSWTVTMLVAIGCANSEIGRRALLWAGKQQQPLCGRICDR